MDDEQWEFFNHPGKQDFYAQHGITWDRMRAADAHGELTPYPRSATIRGMPVAMSYAAYADYEFYLAKAKRGYRQNYAKMERSLQLQGSLVLPAPIVVAAHDEALLFSGYRRLCLAWNYGMVPLVWLITITPGTSVDEVK